MGKNGYLSPTDVNIQNPICVIPCGGLSKKDRRYWEKKDLEHYGFFKGFIFNGICTRDDHFIYPLFVGFAEPSEMTDWLQWIDMLFSTDKNLNALSEIVQAQKGAPVDVWISIPYPHQAQTHFGTVNGQSLNLSIDEDRYQAVVWWLDQFLKRWKKETKPGIQLRGFLWQREAIDGNDEAVVKKTNQWLKAKGILSMWLPNYGSYGYTKWNELGFDVVALNSNYYGNTPYDLKWLKNTSRFARDYHTGLQITIGKGLVYNDTHPIDYFNFGCMDGYKTDCVLVFQFPNQTLRKIYKKNRSYYDMINSFINGSYQITEYPGKSY